MTDQEGKADAQPFHLILLAKDWTGYQNLCRLVTDAHVDGYYYKPRIDREHLARHSEGLIGLSRLPRRRDPARARDRRLGAGPHGSPASTGTSSARATSSSSSRTTACAEQRRAQREAPAARARGRAAARRDERPPLRPRASSPTPTTCCCASAPATTSTRPSRMKFETPRLLPQVRGPDGGALPGPARGDREHPPDRRDGRRSSCRSASSGSRTSRFPTGHTVETLAARGVPARPRSSATATVTPSSRSGSTTSSASSSRWATPATS